MKIRILAAIAAFIGLTFTACDDTTDTIGTSLTDNKDLLNVITDTFQLSSKSIIADSVLARNSTGYLGIIRDPETGAYITGDFMAQFACLENFQFATKDSILSYAQKKQVIADSCVLNLFYTNYYGDSLATMHLTAYEMAKPMSNSSNYYSNYDPQEEGYIRTNGIKSNKTYTLVNLNISDSIRGLSTYFPSISISLNKPYTDRNNKVYNNYGTYLMQKYFENPGNFKNSSRFINNICPGFYFKMKEGLGSMAYVTLSSIDVYYTIIAHTASSTGADSTYTKKVYTSFAGTEEVLQTTTVRNDEKKIKELASDNSCTYVKSPAGIFTEITLPVENINTGHENDTLNAAKVVLTRINNTVNSKYEFSAPSYLLMLPKDSLYSFFEKDQLPDYKKSFITTYSSSYNNYTFNNIAGIINYMADIKAKGIASNSNWLAEHPNWNKVVIVPVTPTYITANKQSKLVKVVNDMSLTSTKLAIGTGKEDSPIKLTVIYSKFNHQ